MILELLLFSLIFSVFSTEIEVIDCPQLETQRKKITANRRVSKPTLEILIQNAFPNESSVALYWEDNVISWEDPKRLIPPRKKTSIASGLRLFRRMQRTRELSSHSEIAANCLFDCIANWFPPFEAHAFVRELVNYISGKVHVGRTDHHGSTFLMIAAYFNAESAVLKQIQREAQIDAVNEFGQTALHWAVIGRSPSCCRALLKQANVNAQGNYGTTPLHIAAWDGSIEILKLLLDSGADSKLMDHFGKRALNYATQNHVQFCRETDIVTPTDSSIAAEECAKVIKAHEAKKKQKKTTKCCKVF